MAAPTLCLGVVRERQVLQVERVLHMVREGAVEVLDGSRQQESDASVRTYNHPTHPIQVLANCGKHGVPGHFDPVLRLAPAKDAAYCLALLQHHLLLVQPRAQIAEHDI